MSMEKLKLRQLADVVNTGESVEKSCFNRPSKI